jgi:DNA (cytosine-5)-methyltransferase 1
MKAGAMFAGYAGLELALDEALDDVALSWYAESDPDASKVLAARFPDVPNLGDVTKVDWSTVEPVDVITGGFPCGDVSSAGKRKGLGPDTATGLWAHMAKAIERLRPSLVVAENTGGLLSAESVSDMEPCPWCMGDDPARPSMRAFGTVLSDLADIGLDARWTGLRASDVGAPHGRSRIFVIAYPHSVRPFRVRDTGTGRGAESTDDGRPTPDPDSVRREVIRGVGAVRRHPDRRPGLREAAGVDPRRWGPYLLAIRRWERIIGRRAPSPVREDGRFGQARINPVFVEWMQGLPDGWVTGIDITWRAQMRVLGNGVIPRQGAEAIRQLLTGAT